MANERKTESIVRRHFEKFENIVIEEQKSDFGKITKLLKNASKKGEKHGSPEFIIHFIENTDFIIVVECKASVSRHESKSHENYSEYAVDGVLLYASFLSKEYDVLAIAVSGENAKELKVSHFLHLKGESKAFEIFGDKLLEPNNYLTGYLRSPEKFRQDYSSLLSFSKDLNETLHSKKIKESQRSLLISGILIALENDAFQVSYKRHTNPENLADILVDTISYELKNANLLSKKLENLKNAYNFIRTHTALSGEENVLSDLIESIDSNVNTFIKTHKYIDVLGQFYIEFLKYANSDSGLGIVLTPPHITELFCELAGVNKDSIVFDNCTGTGGFLISAMSAMVKKAKDDDVKIRNIKSHQLIGIEYQDDIFALACSNMFIHQDGKTNIIHGNCFDEEVIKQVIDHQPTIGLLNPPYQSKKKIDIEEVEFVLNNLEALQPGGVCVAIVPMGCVLATSGKKFELKKRLLKSHTLEAVMSMPDELFINSDVGVVTAVMVITAHKPHPANKQTFFGYWKNDGFVKRKNRGRVDALNKWEAIKEEWVTNYINRTSKPGMGVNQKVGPKDEWCAEAFMETDYSSLSDSDFLGTIRDFSAFLVRNNTL